MRIGDVARQAKVPSTTIRYYEDIGLLPRPVRAANGYRDYSQEAVDRLRFVRDAQDSGLTLEEIASVVELRNQGKPTCNHVISLLEHHLEEVERRIETLKASRDLYGRLIDRARNLDPVHCTDPSRCQTISPATLGVPDALGAAES